MQAPVFPLNKTQLLALAIASVTQAFCSQTWAGPEGGQIITGAGSITQVDKETRIQQASERLGIDWKSFDLNSDERVQFIQPTSSSIAINRILSNKGSLIQGRIDANGQVVLVNPNGIIFTKDASVNAGALVASGVQINDDDFLNSQITLNALEGGEGRVINAGLLNAATGGNVSLIGQYVENTGLISANLGSVNLAAGKEVVLTFEPNGLVGVKVTQATLNNELGVDAALINSGEIKAEGGKVLLTASTSKDIFSQAVNNGELKAAQSVAVHEDGSFTLGAGADVINTGAIDVSSAAGKGGEAVILGNNINNSGHVHADGKIQAGSVELNSTDKTEIKNNGTITANSTAGTGGDIKVLGEKVGLLDQATVEASGHTGGGQILLGGDQTGTNSLINNAQFSYVGSNAHASADATDSGSGGTLIVFAEDTARIYGSLSARGGIDGRGGFVETSGLKRFDLYRAPDLSSISGLGGNWLIDPHNVVIDADSDFDGSEFVNSNNIYTAKGTGTSSTSTIGWSALLSGGPANVQVVTTDGDITFKNSYYFSVGGTKNTSISFDAKGDIKFNAGLVVDSSKASGQPNANASDESLSLTFNAGGVIDFNNTQFHTNGGNFTAKATAGNITSTGTIKTERPTTALDVTTQSGAISITADAGQATFNNISSAGFSFTSGEGDGGNAGSLNITAKQGVIITGSVSSAGGSGKDDISANGVSTPKTGGHANFLTINSSDGPISIAKLSADGGTAGFDTIIGGNNDRRDAAAGGNAGQVTLTASKGDINLTDTASNKFGTGTKDLGTTINPDNGKNGNGANFTLTAKNITTNAIITNANEATFEASETVNLGNLNTQLTKSDCGDGLCRGDVLIKTAPLDTGITVGQSAAWTIRGNTQLTLGAQGSASLNTGASQFAGIGKTLSITAKDATLTSDFALVLKNIAVENLNFFSALDLSQDAAGSVVATNSARLNGKTVVLNNAGNNFNQIDALTSTDNAEISDGDTLTINSLSTPKLAITSVATASLNGDINALNRSVEITQKGAGSVAVTGSATKTGAGDITLKTTTSGIGLNYTGGQTATWNLNSKTLDTNSTRFIYDGFSTLVGGTGNDIFNLGALITPPNISGGSAGTDELHIDANNNVANNWRLVLVKTEQDFTGAQSGVVQATGLNKILVQNVNTNSAPQLTLIDSGVTTWTLTSTSSEFKLQNTNLGGDVTFSGFKQLVGGEGQDIFNYAGAEANAYIGSLDGGSVAADDKIAGFNVDTSWDLTGAQANFYRTASPAQKINFTNIKTLVGGSQKDVITLSSDIDTVNLSSFSTGFTLENFEGITATAGVAKLTGYTQNSTWTLTGDKKGTITSNGKTTEFSGFSELISSDEVTNTDTFEIDANGSIAKITGQSADTLNARTGPSINNNWIINSDGTAQVAQLNGVTETIYVNSISGVGTINGSEGADAVKARGTYVGIIDLKAGTNTLTTNNANVELSEAPLSINGVVGLTGATAEGINPSLTAFTQVANGSLEWEIDANGSRDGRVEFLNAQAEIKNSLEFKGFNTLSGGDNKDIFTLKAGFGSVTTIKGGLGDNSLINTVAAGAPGWNLATKLLRGLGFDQFQTLTAFNGDTLTAPDAVNIFTLAAGGTTLLSTDAQNTATPYTLNNFKTFTGGILKDAFNVNVSVPDVVLNGAAGSDEFTFANETIKASSVNGGAGADVDTLKVTAGANSWTLTAAQTGNVNSSTFTGIEILAGGTGEDTFDNKIAGQTLTLSAIDAGALHATADTNNIAVNVTGMNTVKNLAVLEGFSDTRIWTLTAEGAGNVKNSANAALNFVDVTELKGGNANETFVITAPLTQFALNGGDGNNTLQGADSINIWKISTQVPGVANLPATNAGSLNTNGTFAGIQQFKGGTLADTIDLTGSTGVAASLANISDFENLIGGANSSLIGANQLNNWQLTATTNSALTSGTVNTLTFKDFSALTGGTGQDIFSISNASQFKGTVNGGINSSSAVRDEIKIDSVVGTFVVTDQGVGTLDYINTTNSTATKITFAEIEALTGGSAADKFTVQKDVDMVLDGGAGTAVDGIQLPELDLDIALAVGTALPGINSLTLANFESITAFKGKNSTLRAIDGEATWAINEENSGTLTLVKGAQTSETVFANFNHLVSGAGVDRFIFGDSGSIKTIDANDGDELIGKTAATRWDLTTQLSLTDISSANVVEHNVYAEAVTGLKRLTGGDGNDQFNLATAANNVTNNLVIDGGNGQNTLTSPAGNWNWTLKGSQQGELISGAQKITFANQQNLNAGANQSLTNTAAVNAWSITQSNQLSAQFDGGATQLKQFAQVNTGSTDDSLEIKATYNGAINLGGGKNTVTLGAQGTITNLTAGGVDSITSQYAQSLWTLTEANNKRFISVTSGANTIIGELGGFDSLTVNENGVNGLTSTLDNNQWLITGGTTGSLTAPQVSAVEFKGFKSLLGSQTKDTFAFDNGSVFKGDIDGAGGDNLVDVSTGGQTNYQLNEAQGSEINGVKHATGVKGAGALAQLTLVSPNAASWVISGENKGDLTYAGTQKFSFEGFGILIGGSGADSFDLSAAAAKINRIDGGAHPVDAVNSLTAKAPANIWTIGAGATGQDSTLATTSGTIYLGDFDHIESLIGAGQDKLVVAQGDTQWALDGNKGELTHSLGAMAFSGINVLWGSDGADTYTLGTTLQFADVDGRGGENLVKLASTDAQLDLTQGFAVQGVKNVSGVAGIGDAASLTLVANSDVTWTVTEHNTGTISVLINSQAKTISFEDFANLTGGANNDTFILHDKGFVSGEIKGGTGQNSIAAWTGGNASWSLDNVSTVGGGPNGLKQKFSAIGILNGSDKNDVFTLLSNQTATINAGLGDDTLKLNTAARLTGQFNGGEGKNTVQTVDGDNNWQLTTASSGTVKVADEATVRANFTEVQTLVGGTGADTLNGFNTAANWDVRNADGTVSTGLQGVDKLSFKNMDILTGGTQSDTFKVSGAFAGAIVAGGGDDTLELLAGGTVASFKGGAHAGTGDSITGPLAGAIWQFNSDTNTLTDADGAVLVGDFQEVENLQASTSAEDSVISALADNTWNLTAADAGLLNGIKFTGFDHLKGSDLKDLFVFNFVGTFGKSVDAGAGENTVQLNTVNSVTLDWSNKNVNGVKGANKLIGSNTVDSELSLVSTIDLIWTIDRLDGGSIGDGTNTFNFDGYKNIKGSSLKDEICFINAGRISGAVDAGEGVDTLQGLNRDNSWQLGIGLSVTAVGEANAYVNNAVGFERLKGGTAKDTFAVNARIKADINGGDGDDRLVIGTGSRLDGTFTGGNDKNTVESQLAASRWELTTPANGVLFNGEESAARFTGANNLVAKTAADNSLSFANASAALVWTINGGSGESASGQVQINEQPLSLSTFSGFNQIIGSKGDDDITLSTALNDLQLGEGKNRLTLQAGAKLATLTAGAGSDELKGFAAANLWQMLNATQGKLSSASADVVSEFSGIDIFTGSGSDRLTGAAGTNKWVITAPSAGTLNNTVSFNGFARAQGNGGADTFEFEAASSIAAVDGGEGEDNLIARNDANQWGFTANDRGSIHAPNEANYVSFAGIENFTGATTANDIITLAPTLTAVKLNAGGQAGDELIVQYRDALTLTSDGASWLGITGVKKVSASALTGTRSAQLTSTSSTKSLWSINEENGGDWTTAGATTHFSGFDKILGGGAADEFVLAGGRISTQIDGGNPASGTAQSDSLAAENKYTYWTISATGAGSLTYIDQNNPPIQQFAGIETLLGNGSNDEFRLLTDGISINIRGGNSTGIDKVFFNGALDITLGQQDVVGVGIAEIEFFNANSNTQNTLHSSSTGGIWTLTGENSGRLTSGSETLDFSNFQNLLGGKGDDVFDLDEDARVTGVLSGGEGNNTLTVHHNRDLTATLTADGAGDLTGAQAIVRFADINTLRVLPVGFTPPSATLTAANLPNHWVLTDDTVVLNEFNYSGFTSLNGNESADDFVLSGKQTLSINGRGGEDSLTVKSKKDAQVSWQLVNVFGRVDISNSGAVETSLPLFSNIEHLVGGDGNDAFVLSTSNGIYSHFDGGAGTNSLAATGNNQWQLGALTGDDSPVVDHLNTAELVHIQTIKGAGNDTLLGSDDDTLWQLARGGDASLTQTSETQNRALTATGIGRIKGGKGQDDFVLQESGTGSFARIDGGEVGADSSTGLNTSSVRDSLNATALSADVQVRLDAIANSASIGANQLVVAGIESIELNAANNNSLFGPTLADKQAINWQIAQQKQGSFAPKTGSNSENTVSFSGVNNIIAGAGEDRFVLASLNAIGGELGGGELDGGDGADFIDYSQAALVANQSAFDVVIGESARLKNIEGVIGKNNGSMRLVVRGASSQWLIDDIDGAGTTSDGVNDGRVTLATGKTVDFIDFAALVGTQGSDTFDIKGGLNGAITTGDGADTIAVGVNPNRAQAITLNNDNSDSLRLDWVGVAPAGVKETYKQAANGRESITLEGPLLQPFAVDFTALSSINDRLAVDEMRVQTAFETAGSNRVSLAQNALQLAIDSAGAVKTGTWFNVENKTNLVLAGQTGDQLNLSGKSQLAGTLTLEKFAINSIGGASAPLGEQNLAAGQINFNGVARIGTEQAPLVITTPQVQFNNLSGDAWVKSTSDIKLAALDGQGKLTLNADGIIGQTQLLTYAKELSLKASGGITLDNPDNRLTGALTLESARNIVLANGLTQVDTVTAENLKITGQDLTFVGPMVVAGTTDLTSTGSINAVNTANHLARVQLTTTGSVKLAVGTDSSLAAAKVGGALQVQADGLDVVGDITAASLDLNANTGSTPGRGQLKVSGQLNAPQISLTATDIVLKTSLQGGKLSLNAGSVSLEKPINLSSDFTAQADTLQQSAEAAIDAKGVIDINATGALQLNGNLSSQQNLQVVAGGAINQGGAWTTTSAEGAQAANIAVKSGGTIAMETAASTQSSGAITYEAADTIKLSALSAKGEVAISTAGSIEDVNDVAVNITAPSARLTSAGDIRGLNLAVDSLVGLFSGTANSVNLRNEKTLRIDRLVGDGTISVAAARGDIVFNNDASKNPEVANLYTQTDIARENTGVVNANFTTGTLNILAEKGRVKATGPVNVNQPDLVANTINIFSALGVSTPGRPLVIYSNTVLYTGTGLNWKPFTAFGHRFTFTSDNALDLSQLLLAAGDQLIEVEPLEDVNPAVFTDVRNYSADNISIMLPADQRYED
jgi:filamentous hemagglutinin family protein